MTPLAPRAPYMARLTGSLSTLIDSMSCGEIPLRLPPGPGWMGMPSRTYSGSVSPRRDVAPRIRMAMPSAVLTTVTPATRLASNSSIGAPGARSMSSAVTVVRDGRLSRGAASTSPWLDPLARAHPDTSPTSRPTGSTAREQNTVMGPP